MKKKVKKYVLNTSNNAHKYLMLKNLFTSLVIHGQVTTTDARAKALKSYAQEKLHEFAKLQDSWQIKRWLGANVSTKKFLKKARATLEAAKNAGFKVKDTKVRFRHGDGALMVKLELLVPKLEQKAPVTEENEPQNQVETKEKKAKQEEAKEGK